MTVLWIVWAASAGLLLTAAAVAGLAVKQTPWGLLIDDRERYSLNRFHLLWWLLIIVSMAAGVAAARFTVPNSRPLGFAIPGPVLALMTTVGATTVVASGVKAYRDNRRPDMVASSLPGGAFFGQILLQEEGAGADQTLDVGKFQALTITVLLGLGYVATAVYDFLGRDTPPITGPAQIASLPALDPTFIALLAVSSTAYVGTKLVTREGLPAFSLTDRQATVQTVLDAARSQGKAVDGRALRSLLRPPAPRPVRPAARPAAENPASASAPAAHAPAPASPTVPGALAGAGAGGAESRKRSDADADADADATLTHVG